MTQPTSKQQVLLDLSQWFEAHLDEKTSVTILLEPSLSLVGTLPVVSSWLSTEEKNNLALYTLQNKLGRNAALWSAQVDQISLNQALLWCAVPVTSNTVLKNFSSRIKRLQPACLRALQSLEKNYTGWLVCTDEERVQTLLLRQGYVVSARNWVWEGNDRLPLLLQRHVALSQLQSSDLGLPVSLECSGKRGLV